MEEIIEINISQGKILKQAVGSVTCSKYEGVFVNPNLAGKAETGLWYTSLSGNPFVIQGEGLTPELAIQNAINRTKDRIAVMKNGLTAMEDCDILFS